MPEEDGTWRCSLSRLGDFVDGPPFQPEVSCDGSDLAPGVVRHADLANSAEARRRNMTGTMPGAASACAFLAGILSRRRGRRSAVPAARPAGQHRHTTRRDRESGPLRRAITAKQQRTTQRGCPRRRPGGGCQGLASGDCAVHTNPIKPIDTSQRSCVRLTIRSGSLDGGSNRRYGTSFWRGRERGRWSGERGGCTPSGG